MTEPQKTERENRKMARITITELNKIYKEIDRQHTIAYWTDNEVEEWEAQSELLKLYNKLNEARAEMRSVCYLIDVNDAYDVIEYIRELLPCFIHFDDIGYTDVEECSITTYPEYISTVEELLKDFV